jgi:pimeloyl-ACP methyl ester carboxylesterase
MAFGASPSPPDVELLRQMLDAMSPRALAALVPHLFSFDVRNRLGALSLPVQVVVGSRDVLTPPRTARVIAERVPQARLTLLEGCGHMVMLERPDALHVLLTE